MKPYHTTNTDSSVINHWHVTATFTCSPTYWISTKQWDPYIKNKNVQYFIRDMICVLKFVAVRYSLHSVYRALVSVLIIVFRNVWCCYPNAFANQERMGKIWTDLL